MADIQKNIIISVKSDTAQVQSDVGGLHKEIESLRKEVGSLKGKLNELSNTEVGAKQFTSFKQELKAANNEVLNLSQKFGIHSKEVREAAKRAAELKDHFQDTNKLIQAFNPDNKLAAVTNATKSFVGLAQVYQGAMSLFNDDTEEVAESIKKLQALLALSTGLDQLANLKESFQNIIAVLGITTGKTIEYQKATTEAAIQQEVQTVATETQAVAQEELAVATEVTTTYPSGKLNTGQ